MVRAPCADLLFQTPSERAVRRWNGMGGMLGADRVVSNPFRAGGEALHRYPRRDGADLTIRFKPLQSGR